MPSSDLACTQSCAAFGRLYPRRIDRVNVGIGGRFALDSCRRPDAHAANDDGCFSGTSRWASRSSRVPVSSAACTNASDTVRCANAVVGNADNFGHRSNTHQWSACGRGGGWDGRAGR